MKTIQKRCCICKKYFYGVGNNPDPVKKKGVCCDKCNLIYVLPKRLNLIKG